MMDTIIVALTALSSTVIGNVVGHNLARKLSREETHERRREEIISIVDAKVRELKNDFGYWIMVETSTREPVNDGAGKHLMGKCFELKAYIDTNGLWLDLAIEGPVKGLATDYQWRIFDLLAVLTTNKKPGDTQYDKAFAKALSLHTQEAPKLIEEIESEMRNLLGFHS